MSGILSRIVYALVIGIVIFASGFSSGYFYAGKALRDKALAQVKESAVTSAKTQESIHQLDKKQTEALDNANREINRLRSLIDSGKLRFAAKCGVPESAGNTGVGDGKTVSYLDGTTANHLLDLTDYGDKAIRQLTFCQETLIEIQKEYMK